MTRDEALRILGLDEDATEADVKLAYKEMAQILHPDKFADNKKLAERATEQFKQVNEARELLLKDRRTRSSTSGTGSAGRQTGRRADSYSYADSPASGGSGASSLKARLAGIAAARVQAIAQRDAEKDRRRVGVYLIVGGIVGMVIGVRIRLLEPIAGIALISGAVQAFSANANIKTINGHLASLDKDRQKCEEELENI